MEIRNKHVIQGGQGDDRFSVARAINPADTQRRRTHRYDEVSICTSAFVEPTVVQLGPNQGDEWVEMARRVEPKRLTFEEGMRVNDAVAAARGGRVPACAVTSTRPATENAIAPPPQPKASPRLGVRARVVSAVTKACGTLRSLLGALRARLLFWRNHVG